VVLLHKARAAAAPPQIIKQELVAQAGPQVLRTAVAALMERAAQKALERPKQQAAPLPTDALPSFAPGDDSPVGSGPAHFVGAMMKDEFRVQLVHAFHCRTASCPVPQCSSLVSQLDLLHQHVSSCSAEKCILCHVWRFLQFYRDLDESPVCLPADGSGSPQSTSSSTTQAAPEPQPLMYQDQMDASKRMPRVRQGLVAWAPAPASTDHMRMRQGAGITREGAMNTRSLMRNVGTEWSREPMISEPSQKRVRVAGSTSARSQKPARSFSVTGAQQGVLHMQPSMGTELRRANLSFSGAIPDYPGDVEGPNEWFAEAQNSKVRKLSAMQGGDFGRSQSDIPLTEITSNSFSELLKQGSFSDLDAALQMSQHRKELKAKNSSDVSISAFLEGPSGHPDGLRDIMAEFAP